MLSRLYLHGFYKPLERPLCLVCLWLIYKRHGAVITGRLVSIVLNHPWCPTLPPPAEGSPHGSASVLLSSGNVQHDWERYCIFRRGVREFSAIWGEKKTQLPLDCNFAINPAPSATLIGTHELIIYQLIPLSITLLIVGSQRRCCLHHEYGKTVRGEQRLCETFCITKFDHMHVYDLYNMKLGYRLRN